MALEYTLEFCGDITPRLALEQLSRIDGLEVSGDAVRTGAITGHVGVPDEVRTLVIRESTGIAPSIEVRFRLDKFANREAAKRDVIRATLGLLEQGDGDAALLFNGEEFVLTRIAGRLVLNDSLGFWTTALRSVVEGPFELEAIPPI